MDISNTLSIDYNFIYDNYFVISSENCEHINSKFYGYALNNNIFSVYKLKKPDIINNYSYGYYTNIIDSEDTILIQQDFYGMFGLYLYNKKNFFAISNSLLMLINYLRSIKIDIYMNNNYFTSQLWTITSLDYKKTIINEIEHVPHFYMIKIDKKNKNIEKVKLFQKKNYIDIDSREGLLLIDSWHDKWNHTTKTFSRNNLNLSVDISGGFDSRAALSVIWGNDACAVDIAKTRFESYGMPDYSEDYQLASLIGQKLNFKLNAYPEPDEKFISQFLTIANCLLNKMTLHNELSFYTIYKLDPFFYFGGAGGEFLRDHWTTPLNKFILQFLPSSSERIVTSIFQTFIGSYQRICAEYNSPYGDSHKIYECCRGKLHFGLGAHIQFLANRIGLHPLLDPDLAKLKLLTSRNKDYNILLALLYTRFLPELEAIPFDSKKRLNSQLIEYAKDLNIKYPRSMSQEHPEITIDIGARVNPAFREHRPEIVKYLINLYNSKHFRMVISELYGEDIYETYRKIFNSETLFLFGAYYLEHHVGSLISTYIAYLAVHRESHAEIDSLLVNLLNIGAV